MPIRSLLRSPPLFLVLGFAAFAPAQAQTHGADESVAGRARPAYDALGLRLRSFELFPSIGVSVSVDDNVYAAESAPQSETVTTISPSLAIRSNWSRHALSLEASGVSRRYQALDGEDTDTWRAGADARLDVRRDFQIGGALSSSEAREMRGSNDPFGLAEPIALMAHDASLRFNKAFNRVRVSGALGASEVDYEDAPLQMGGVLDQDFRDRSARDWRVRGDYGVSPGTAVFVSYENRSFDYDLETFRNRDFSTQRALTGVALEFGNLVRGELGAGYVWSVFDDETVAETNGFSLRGRLEWYPTRLTTVTFDLERYVSEAGVAPAVSTLREDFGARVDHELLRNLILSAGTAWFNEDFNAIDRADARVNVDVGVTWLVNRIFGLSLNLSREDHSSSGLDRDRDYDRNVVTAGVTLQR